jgi:biopolymer transport protein ExbD/biopolymer transport protein TolR
MDAGNGTGKAVAQINVTPMIDVLLVLLIIFMMIQPKAPSGLNSQIPQQSKSGDATPPSTVVVEVSPSEDSGPVYRINQTVVPRAELAAKLREIFAPRSDRAMFVKGDAALNFEDVAEVVNMGHAAGVETIGLITPRTQGAD